MKLLSLAALFLAALLGAAGCNPKAPPGNSASREPSAAADEERPAMVMDTELPAAVMDKEPPRAPDAVVVDVNGAKLLQRELDAQVVQVMSSQGLAGAPPESLPGLRARMGKQLTDRFVVQTLLLDQAKQQKIRVEPQDMTNALKEIRSRVPEGKTLEEALADAGVAMTNFLKDVEQGLTLRKLVEARSGGATKASDEAVAEFYKKNLSRFAAPETVRARHILLKCDEDAEAATRQDKRKQADALRVQLTNGADFAALATAHSDCPSKSRGGDLGKFSRGSMVKEFETAAFSQKTNEVGPVIQTKFGFHIVQVSAHEPARTQSLDEVKGDIADHLKTTQERKTIDSYIAELKSKATIRYADGMAPDAGAADSGDEDSDAPDADAGDAESP